MSNRWRQGLVVAALTACACLITLLALPDYSSVDTYANELSHGAMTDFYERAASHAKITTVDSAITVVAIDDCSHDEIAEVLDIVNDCSPRAIGLDVLFYTVDNDTHLKASLKDTSPLLVLPVNVGESLPSQAFINADTLALAKFGRPDLSQNHRGTPVRNYYVRIDGELSFAAQLAQMSGIDLNGRHDLEPLRYGSQEFYVVDGRRMLDDDDIPAERFYGKTVIIGTVHDINDMHYTPINDDMPGVMIHAYALAALMSQRPVTSFPQCILYIAAILFTAATIMLCMRVGDRPYSNLVSRVVPLFIIAIFIYVCYYFYIHRNIYIDFPIVLTMTAAGILAYDIYTGVPALTKGLCQRIGKFFLRFKK